MQQKTFLPLGSIVALKGDTKKFMIVQRVVAIPVGEDAKRFDYGACLYPEGVVGDRLLYFNAGDIAEVVQEGYTDAEDAQLQRALQAAFDLAEGKENTSKEQLTNVI